MDKKNKWNLKKVCALVGLLILVGMYVLSFIAAFSKSENAFGLLMTSFALTFIIPLMMYCILAMVKEREKRTDGRMSLSELRKYNKRLKNGEDPKKLAEEIEKKYPQAAPEVSSEPEETEKGPEDGNTNV